MIQYLIALIAVVALVLSIICIIRKNEKFSSDKCTKDIANDGCGSPHNLVEYLKSQSEPNTTWSSYIRKMKSNPCQNRKINFSSVDENGFDYIDCINWSGNTLTINFGCGDSKTYSFLLPGALKWNLLYPGTEKGQSGSRDYYTLETYI